MASEGERVCWVLKDTADGTYMDADGDWTAVCDDAREFDTLDEARKVATNLVETVRVVRRKKADCLILTGEAARLVREWRALDLVDRNTTKRSAHPWIAKMLAALASEEVRDAAEA